MYFIHKTQIHQAQSNRGNFYVMSVYHVLLSCPIIQDCHILIQNLDKHVMAQNMHYARSYQDGHFITTLQIC